MGIEHRLHKFRNKLARRIAYTGNSEYLKDSFAHLTLGSFGGSNSEALKLSAVWACVRILSEVPSTLPRMVLKDVPTGGKEPVKTHSVYKLLHEPNSFMHGVTYHQVMLSNLHMQGNAVAPIFRNNYSNAPETLLPVNWEDVTPTINDGQMFYNIRCSNFGIDRVFHSSDVIHIKLFSSDGLIGRNPASHARHTIGNGHAEADFEQQFWEKGGNAKNVVEDPKPFPPKEKLEEWKKVYKQINGGQDNNHGTLFLDNGKTIKQLPLPLLDQKFIALKTFTVQDICRWWGVPPNMVYDLLKSSYNTLEQQNRAWVQNRLRPDVKNMEEEYELKLFTDAERATHHIKFNLDGLLRGDTRSTTALAQMLVQTGTATRNEVRDIFFNLNPSAAEGMDIPLNPAYLAGKQFENTKTQSNE